MFEIDEYLSLLKSEKLKRAVRIQGEIIHLSRTFLKQKGFVEILPVIISPITDPLTDYRIRGEIECYSFKYQITKSMIFHKQISLLSLPRIFSFSPNVRIESASRQKSGKHLIEFVQLDIEIKEAGRKEIIKIGEELLIYILKNIKPTCGQDLAFFKRDLRIPEQPGILVDMDLIYPEGYGEALSGGEREYQHDRIKKRIKQKKIGLQAYQIYLQFAERGLYPSAGFGIGIERLTRFVCGLSRIEETRIFAKLPGRLGL
ncbi:MAG: asparagine synthetase A [Acidobacteriota bacterium]